MLNDFMDELREELIARNAEDMADVLQYFDEVITDRKENGEDIEEILSSLGSPKKIVESLYGKDKGISSADEDEVRNERLVFPQARQIKVDSADYYFEILPSENDDAVLEFESDRSKTLVSRFRHEKLEIEEEYAYHGLGFLRGLFTKLSGKNSRTLHATLYVPKNRKISVEFDNVSGDLRFSSLDLKTLEIDSVSGTVAISDCTLSDLEAESVSGNIVLLHSYIGNKAGFDLVSGSFSATQLACRKITAETVSGNIDLSMMSRRDETGISVSSRDLDLDLRSKHKKNTLRLESVSGNITYRFIDD